MKLMFIADIHGSEFWLDKVLDVYAKGDFDRLVILGDVLYHGPRNPLPEGYEPSGVLAKLNISSEEIIAIRGNCDSEVDQMVLNFRVLNEESHLILEDKEFFLCHGHHLDEGKLPKLRKGTVICHGHTHIPRIDEVENHIIFNPGSIALPKMNTPHSYGVYENGKLKVIRLETGETFLENAFQNTD